MKLNLVVLKTAEIDALEAFYTRMGLMFEYHRHGTGPMHYAATLENVVLEIYPLPKAKASADDTLRLGFVVDNLDEIVKDLKAGGAKIIKEPLQTEYGYMAIVEDIDGRKVELTQEGSSIKKASFEAFL